MAINETIYNAIQMVADDTVERANYDRTIKAQIVSCEDQKKGKYKCSYNDIEIIAYSVPNISYEDGTDVYILVPQNNFKKQKTILRSVDNKGTNYMIPFIRKQIEQQDMIINQPQMIYLSSDIKSNGKKQYKRAIYEWNGSTPSSNNDITIYKDTPLNQDGTSPNAEIVRQKSGGLRISAQFNTNFSNNVIEGHYGIGVVISFANDVLKYYLLRDSDFKRDHLHIKKGHQLRTVDIANLSDYVKINSIYIYDYGFREEGDPQIDDPRSESQIIADIPYSVVKIPAEEADIVISNLQVTFYSYNSTGVENPTRFFREDGLWAKPASGSTTVDITEVTDEPSNIDLEYDKIYKLTVNGVSKNFKTPTAPAPTQNALGGEILFTLSGTTNFEVGRRIQEN